MDIRVGTFNLNNLFSRFNVYTEADRQISSDSEPATKEEPRDWLEGAEAPEAKNNEVRVTGRGTVGPDGKVVWYRTFMGKMVWAKKPKEQETLADRVKALDVDVLAVQEVENLVALEDFVRYFKLKDEGFKYISLVEGNDNRLIDVGVISKLPLGEVTSWRHWTHPDNRDEPAFSRDLLQVEILDESFKPILTVYVNHLKSQLARNEEERKAADLRRRRQAECIVEILKSRPPETPYLVVGDMNDTPDSPPLSSLKNGELFDALAEAEERGGPYPADDPTPPPDRPWTHRYRGGGETTYELYDQIWASPDLQGKVAEAWILRRTLRGGNASDHDPAAVELSGLK